MNREQRLAEIRRRLEAAFQPQALEVVDEGHLHVGHEGAKDGRGHFRLRIVSDRFAGQGMVQRHRLIYQAMGELMHSDIHALAMDARAPDEDAG
jgi:BolA protein